MRAKAFYFSLALLLCVNGAALAQDEGQKKSAPDPNKGAVLAERWCASCHIVASTQAKGSDITPSFASIAQRADFSVEKLALFLLDPHPIMPKMALSRDDASDLAAYIANQRQ
jgi:mono/diheme cytochrome c family protein